MNESGHRVLAIVAAAAELMLAPPALFFAATSVMMFDAPGSEAKTGLWVIFYSIAGVPVALVVGAALAIAAAVRYTRGRMLASWGVSGRRVIHLIVPRRRPGPSLDELSSAAHPLLSEATGPRPSPGNS